MSKPEETIDPLDQPSNLKARTLWPWNKTNTHVKSKSEVQRRKNAERARKSYKAKRAAEGKPYIPMVVRMKGREAAKEAGYEDWGETGERGAQTEGLTQDEHEIKLEHLLVIREGIDRAIETERKAIGLGVMTVPDGFYLALKQLTRGAV